MNDSEVQSGATAESSSQQEDEIPYLDGIGLLKEMNSANVVVIVSIVSASVVLLLVAVVIGILLCRKNRKQTGTDKYGHNNKSSPDSGYPANDSDSHNNLLSGSNDQKAFYENLPFHGLNPPGKKVDGRSVFDRKDEDMIYADADYKDVYEFGPVSYHTVSKEAAVKKKEDDNARVKAAISYSSRTNDSTSAAVAGKSASDGNSGNPTDNGNPDSNDNSDSNETSKQPEQ